jgi:hypothetical protein
MILQHQRGPVLFALTQLAYSRHFALLRSLCQLLWFTRLPVRTVGFATDLASQRF